MCNGPPEVPLKGTSTSDGKPNTDTLGSISITPGTVFMQQLSKYFHYFIRKKMEHDWVWRRCTVIFSGSEVTLLRTLQSNSSDQFSCQHKLRFQEKANIKLWILSVKDAIPMLTTLPMKFTHFMEWYFSPLFPKANGSGMLLIIRLLFLFALCLHETHTTGRRSYHAGPCISWA